MMANIILFHDRVYLITFIWILASFVCTSATNTCITPANLDQSHIGKCMVGHVLSEVPCISHARCLHECMTITGCLSYNWRREEQLCQLNTENGTTAPTSLVPADGGCFFSAVTSWPKVIVKDCADHVCATSEQCIPGPRCIKVCLEPVIPNAVVIERTTRYPGGTRKYGCSPGSLKTGTGDTITCQSDGSWTSITFQCILLCPADPPAIPFTTIAPNSDSLVLVYNCLSGYTKTASDVTTCLETGEWSPVSEYLCIQCNANCLCARNGADCIAMCDENASLPDSGRLEIRKCSDPVWATICDDCWVDGPYPTDCVNNPHNPNVSCQMLGYSGGVAQNFPGPESTPIGLDEVQCNGTETSLYDCPGAVTNHDCSHTEDVGVICS